LDDVELLVNRGEASLGLDEDETVHAVSLMDTDGTDGAVVDVETRVQELELGLLAAVRVSSEESSSSARTSDSVEVNVVKHARVVIVGKVDLHVVTLARANHGTGNRAVEGPELVLVDIINGQDLDFRGHVDDELDGVVAGNGRGDIGSEAKDGDLTLKTSVLARVVALSALLSTGRVKPAK